MDLKRLRTFVAVAELGTVSSASLHLRISQPALSRQINDVEQEFGFRLFDRVGRRLVLTAVGEQVLVDCRRVLGEVALLGERRTAPARRQRSAKGGGTAADNRECSVEIPASIQPPFSECAG